MARLALRLPAHATQGSVNVCAFRPVYMSHMDLRICPMWTCEYVPCGPANMSHVDLRICPMWTCEYVPYGSANMYAYPCNSPLQSIIRLCSSCQLRHEYLFFFIKHCQFFRFKMTKKKKKKERKEKKQTAVQFVCITIGKRKTPKNKIK
ncbi:hypothetical protein POVWA2_026370 [Plasmodium ovale wallikeri]|uniref:Uncharacterized protein n=1 Tax=Plasmodium ovale wallikeri TaxID=864142 RepID=A0A1A8YUD8_PLAOA|nr:hypothetical protein POVWA1_026370 [Plasmodium ovale wallikeri]SBT35703.1 hypothetical protein POVWA2_026370 [Plasmodium ovale wallikeri]